ncbi:MAG TPA: hypothetical protein VD905_15155 [Flavobacteriales bacterium]|nr:hypothetical protein [Flavobacteriales bacterium]
MKRFLKKITLFILPLFVCAVVLEIMLRQIPNDYSLKKEFISTHPEKIDVLVLGSSHALRGVNPSHFDLKCFNASYVSQTLDMDWCILDKFGPQLIKARYIVLSVSYFTFFTRLKSSEESWRAKNYTIYYGISDGFNIKNSSEVLSSPTNVSIDKFADYYIRKKSIVTCDSLGFAPRKNRTTKNFARLGLKTAKRHTKSGELFFENLRYLEHIVQFCRRTGKQLVLFMPPGHISYRKHLKKSQLKKTIFTADSLTAVHKHVRFLNYLASPVFDDGDFYDPDHLNNAGALKLSNLLNKELMADMKTHSITLNKPVSR